MIYYVIVWIDIVVLLLRVQQDISQIELVGY